jgi:hypothetical protein
VVGLSQGKVKKYSPKPVTVENISNSRSGVLNRKWDKSCGTDLDLFKL